MAGDPQDWRTRQKFAIGDGFATRAETAKDNGERDLGMMKRSILLAVTLTFAAICLAEDNSTPQQVFDGMRGSFQTEKAKGVHAKYQWNLSGPNGGDWWIDVEDGKFTMGKGKIDNPTVTFITSDNDWVAMSNGKLKGSWAYMTGRLKVHGPKSVARKLDEIFP